MRVRRSFTLLAFLLLTPACGSSESNEANVNYSTTAKSNYEKGLKELKDENFPEALKYFNFVKQKFPFSKYAVLAELRIADTQFDRGRFLEAIDEYKMFERSHPTNEFVEDGYVGFKVCESYTKQMPDDFFLVPPAYEKDQSPTKDALRELDAFLAKYPQSKYADKARQYRQTAVYSLAQSELYVAKFYLRRGKARAASWRLETLLKLYSGTQLDPQVLLLLGEAHANLKEFDKAREAWVRLLKEHPHAKEAVAAQGHLNKLAPSPGERHG